MTTELIACSLSNIKMQKTDRGKPSMQKYWPASDLGVGQTRCDCTSLDNSLVAGRIFYGTLH